MPPQHDKYIGTVAVMKWIVLPLVLLVGGKSCVCHETLPVGKTEISKLQINQLEGALGLFHKDVGRYPTTREGLSGLIRNPGVQNWYGPYPEKMTIPADPYGRAFLYRSPGDHGEYDLWSLGADGLAGGSERDADIVSW